MKEVYITSTDCITPLGASANEVFSRMLENKTGIRSNESGGYAAAFTVMQQEQIFGKIFSPQYPAASAMLETILDRLHQSGAVSLQHKNTLLVICSTKGDIEALSGRYTTPLLGLGIKMADRFRAANTPVIISNACISSLHGLIYARRLVASGAYDQVVVAGVDAETEFITSGFASLMATSSDPCRPFDERRNGITLGEAVAVAVVAPAPAGAAPVKIVGGAVANDANHITGPSRDGSGLFRAIDRCLKVAGTDLKNEAAFLSPHGTATVYNDEMESKAFFTAGLNGLPAVAYKGYFGHTLGAAGILEAVIGLETLHSGTLPVSTGYERDGVSHPMNFRKPADGPSRNNTFRYYLKTGSGFGGCNAAVLFEKSA